MSEQTEADQRKISRRILFQIFLKTGRKRVTLSVISGIVIFLTITALIMVVNIYRYNSFLDYTERNVEWMNDGVISVSTNKEFTGNLSLQEDSLAAISQEFFAITAGLVPNTDYANVTTCLSCQIYTYNPPPPDPWLNHEIMTFNDEAYYGGINDSLVEGRLPNNYTELLWYRNENFNYTINDTIKLYTVEPPNVFNRNYTIVGIVENVESAFYNNSFSSDIFNWDFGADVTYQNYDAYNRFFTNYTLFSKIFNTAPTYHGVVTYLMDIEYDLQGLKLQSLSKYINNFPDPSDRPLAETTNSEVIVAPDLKAFLVSFTAFWVDETSSILLVNSPLLFLIGLLIVVALTIGSRELDVTFRRMKLYGLNYRLIRQLIFLENLVFTLSSSIIGIGLGFALSVLTTMGTMENRPSNFYANFIQEPLLYIVIGTFILVFFSLSFFIQNSIAKKTVDTASEEYKKRRRKIANIFSTNEFRLFVIALIFSIISLSLYLAYNLSEPGEPITSNLSYQTFFWFMLSCSIAFIMTFAFLLIARLTTLLWHFISTKIWQKRLNAFSLTLRHMSVNKSTFQLAIIGSLLFGLLFFPGFGMSYSIQNQLAKEASMQMSSTNLIIENWFDPDEEFDAILDNITEITNYTEVEYYKLSNDNSAGSYDNAFTIYMLGLESPSTFISMIDTALVSKSCDIEDIVDLEADMHVLMDKTGARRHKLKPGEQFFTAYFTRYRNLTITMNETFRYFPLTPLPKKNPFSSIDTHAMVGNVYTIREMVRAVGFDTDVYSSTMKLINTVNVSSIETAQNKLAASGWTAESYEEVFDELFSNVNIFSRINLLMISILASIALFFIGYFTGIEVYQERVRIIGSLYRVGAVRGQLVGLFTIELVLIATLPLLVTMFSSLPLLNWLATYFLGVQEQYYWYKPGIPVWLYFVAFLAGIAISAAGWFLAIVPAIYRFRPIKQE